MTSPLFMSSFSLRLLPRLFGGELKKSEEELFFFATEIPRAFATAEATSLPADKIVHALSASDERVRVAFPTRESVCDSEPREGCWWDLACAMRGLTESRAVAIANHTSSKWLKAAMSKPRHW